jgi:uncharacterized protein YecT (DUF1311 family)
MLCAVVVGGCSGGGGPANSTTSTPASALRPPRLRTTPEPNSVARFPCPKHPWTTIELESCSARSVLALDGRINDLIKVIWARLDDPAGRSLFADAERAWELYVGNECTSRARAWVDRRFPHSYVGGTSAPVARGACEVELTSARILELTKTASALGPR